MVTYKRIGITFCGENDTIIRTCQYLFYLIVAVTEQICYFSNMIRERKIFLMKFSCLLTILIVLFVAPDCCDALEIMNFRYWTAPDHTRIVLDVDGVPNYKIRESENLFILSLQGSVH